MQDLLVEAGPTLSKVVLDMPFVTMKIDIHHGDCDRIEVEFDPNAKRPFDVNELTLEDLLPL
jgi:hypothetical protein